MRPIPKLTPSASSTIFLVSDISSYLELNPAKENAPPRQIEQPINRTKPAYRRYFLPLIRWSLFCCMSEGVITGILPGSRFIILPFNRKKEPSISNIATSTPTPHNMMIINAKPEKFPTSPCLLANVATKVMKTRGPKTSKRMPEFFIL